MGLISKISAFAAAGLMLIGGIVSVASMEGNYMIETHRYDNIANCTYKFGYTKVYKTSLKQLTDETITVLEDLEEKDVSTENIRISDECDRSSTIRESDSGTIYVDEACTQAFFFSDMITLSAFAFVFSFVGAATAVVSLFILKKIMRPVSLVAGLIGGFLAMAVYMMANSYFGVQFYEEDLRVVEKGPAMNAVLAGGVISLAGSLSALLGMVL